MWEAIEYCLSISCTDFFSLLNMLWKESMCVFVRFCSKFCLVLFYVTSCMYKSCIFTERLKLFHSFFSPFLFCIVVYLSFHCLFFLLLVCRCPTPSCKGSNFEVIPDGSTRSDYQVRCMDLRTLSWYSHLSPGMR